MPLRLALLTAVISLGSLAARAQAGNVSEYDDDPLTLTEAFVRRLVRPHTEAFTAEAAANPISPARLPRAPQVRSQLSWRESSRALVSVEFSNRTSAEDLYVFLDSLPGEGWRIEAFRAFELPSVYYQQLDRYRNQGERSIREAYAAKWARSREKGITLAQHEAVHGSEDDRVFYVFNLRLASSSDADLVRHFEFLKERFEGLRQNLSALPPSKIPVDHGNEQVGDDLRYLLVKRAYRDEGPLRLEVASIAGDAVGYLYCADASCMPTPTPGGVIALKELGGGWWLYRTT